MHDIVCPLDSDDMVLRTYIDKPLQSVSHIASEKPDRRLPFQPQDITACRVTGTNLYCMLSPGRGAHVNNASVQSISACDQRLSPCFTIYSIVDGWTSVYTTQ